jgi:ADP-ribosyl-[dinitrogen reductase] hydrolase
MMKHPNPGMLLFIAMADAYAAALEFIERYPKVQQEKIQQALKFEAYLRHPKHKDIALGAYTDDGEMSVANARVLIENDPLYRKADFAESFVREFKRGGMRKGYSGRFYKFIASLHDGQEFIAKIKSDSEKNGAAMRSVPIGVLPTVADVLETASLQASLTHNTPVGLFSARVVALMSHFSLYHDEPLNQSKEYCQDHLLPEELSAYGFIFQKPWSGGPVIAKRKIPISITTVHAVVDLLTTQKSLMDIMRQLLVWRGDTDTVAAIAWGIFSARAQREELPEFMVQKLEGGNPHTGERYLRSIGEQLMNKFSAQGNSSS